MTKLSFIHFTNIPTYCNLPTYSNKPAILCSLQGGVVLWLAASLGHPGRPSPVEETEQSDPADRQPTTYVWIPFLLFLGSGPVTRRCYVIQMSNLFQLNVSSLFKCLKLLHSLNIDCKRFVKIC